MKKIALCLIALFSVNVLFAQDYTWEMERGFGNDQNTDGRIDIPNTPEYAATTSFDVTFGVTDSFLKKKGLGQEVLSTPAVLFLEADGGSRITVGGTVGALVCPKLAVGQYRGVIRFTHQGKTFEIPVQASPKRYLIAVLGDSYSSGEGAPDYLYDAKRTSIWADDGVNSWEKINHLKAHRSSQAWGPQLALFLEEQDPHSSILFVFFPVSGGRINKSLLVEDFPKDETIDDEKLPSQIEDLKRVVGNQKIDYLLMTIGGNDLGFVPVVTMTLLVNGQKHPEKMTPIIDGMRKGEWEGGFARLMGYNEEPKRIGLEKLGIWYQKIDDAFKKNFDIGQVVLLEYILPLSKGTIAMDDLFSGFKIDETEATLFIDKIVEDLRRVQEESCEKLGWTYAPVLESINFELHHYNAEKAHPSQDYNQNRFLKPTSWSEFKARFLNAKNAVSFFRTCSDSQEIQGAYVDGKRPNPISTGGTFHPNQIGYQAMMHQALKVLTLPKNFPSAFQNEYLSQN